MNSSAFKSLFSPKTVKQVKGESGVSLVELIIVLGVFALLAVAIVGVFISANRASDGASSGSLLATESTLVANSLNTGLDFSTSFSVSELSDGVEAVSASGISATGTSICRYWVFGADNSAYYLESPVAIPLSEFDSTNGDWVLLVSGMDKVKSNYFSTYGTDTLRWAFRIADDNGESMTLEGASRTGVISEVPDQC